MEKAVTMYDKAAIIGHYLMGATTAEILEVTELTREQINQIIHQYNNKK